MSPIAIKTENLSKRYRLGARQENYKSLRDSLMTALKAPWRGGERRQGEDIWAVKDICLEIEQGEAVGIIGRNGAGKSTLLRLLARITRPTSGRAWIHGRVGSLLEVGTGFHPELTGRENIYLNGAILGMRRGEIVRKFDEIVDFAEIEQFLDTPVKRYSSGMYMRLAFAVAAHLDPEILLVDEVLAVGDMAFQKKCLGKMGEVTHAGRTVLFVSHNMGAIQQLCRRVILIKEGNVSFAGLPSDAIRIYYGNQYRRAPMLQISETTQIHPGQGATLCSVGFFDGTGSPCTSYFRNDKAHIRVAFTVEYLLRSFNIAMAFVHADGTPVFSEALSDQTNVVELIPGEYIIEFIVEMSYFKLEQYFLTIYLINEGSRLDNIDGLPIPEIVDPSADILIEARRWGMVRLPVSWSAIERIKKENNHATFG